MAEGEEQVVELQLQDKFYQDSFGKLIIIIASVMVAIILLIATIGYLYFNQPPPKTFPVDAEWRIKPPVPLDQPYLSTPELSQWAIDTVRHLFVFDFNHYNDQLKVLMPYFTDDGWKIFLNQLNIYANPDSLVAEKGFVLDEPTGAPIILNQGLLSGRWAWWVQIPVDINYAYAGGVKLPATQSVTLQILIVRVSTLNNLLGVAIDNVVVVTKNQDNQPSGNG